MCVATAADEYTAVSVNEDEQKDVDQHAGSDDEFEDEPLRAMTEEEGMDALFDPPSRSCTEWVEEWTEQLLSALAKPRTIMAFNALVYSTYIARRSCHAVGMAGRAV